MSSKRFKAATESCKVFVRPNRKKTDSEPQTYRVYARNKSKFAK